MNNEEKFILVLGDHEDVVHLEQHDFKIVNIALNFTQSPSIGAVYRTYPECAKDYADKFRQIGNKVGVYASRDKAYMYLYKSLNIYMGDERG